MFIHSAPLALSVEKLRAGHMDLLGYVDFVGDAEATVSGATKGEPGGAMAPPEIHLAPPMAPLKFK